MYYYTTTYKEERGGNENLLFSMKETIEERAFSDFLYVMGTHLGNVNVVVSDKKLQVDDNNDGTVDWYRADVRNTQDYYAFGMQMPGRNFNAASYRFGYNGKEKDDEIKGSGNSIAFEARVFDPRLGRWLSVDPLTNKMPWMSPYSYALDNPVYFIDHGGAIPWPIPKEWKGAGWNTKSGWVGQIRKTHIHQGVDINSNLGGSGDLGAPVYSTHTGKVVDMKSYNTHKNGSGTIVVIQSPDGSFQTAYMHLNTATIKKDEEIKEGQQIGTVGGTGFGKKDGQSVHLHYEIRKKSKAGEYEAIDPEEGKRNSGTLIDPQKWISGSSDNSSTKLGITGQTYISAAPEMGFTDKVFDAVKSFFTGKEKYYDESYFKTMDKYEKLKNESNKK